MTDHPLLGTKERQKHLAPPTCQEDQRCTARSSRAHLPATTAGRTRRRMTRTRKARRQESSKQRTSSSVYRRSCGSCSSATPAAGAGRSLDDSSSSNTTVRFRRHRLPDLFPKEYRVLLVLQQGFGPHAFHWRPCHNRELKTTRVKRKAPRSAPTQEAQAFQRRRSLLRMECKRRCGRFHG